MEASNLQELKDAATELMRFTCNSCEQRFCEEDVEEEDGQRVSSPCGVIIRMRNALSANPIRNCDRFKTKEEAAIAFANEKKQWIPQRVLWELTPWLDWLFATAKEGEDNGR